VAGALLALGCSAERRPPLFDYGKLDGSAASDAPAFDLDSALGAEGGDCGRVVVPVVVERPNLYFVIDRSGSMADPLTGSPYTKYTAARVALADVLRAIGHRVNYGAAIYPTPFGTEECGAGIEAFPTTPGDPLDTSDAGTDGPVLTDFLTRLARTSPSGGTPLSATLTALQPSLEALGDKTFAVIVTDGAPNCNADATCDASSCMLNVEGQCPIAGNCCDPALTGAGAQVNCVDSAASVAAVEAYRAAGIDTYVIGMPGSELYGSVLDQLAVAGNTARPDSPRYYAVSAISALETALRQIGVDVVASCDLSLVDKPPDPNLVNVYFDSTVIPFDLTDGWSWTSDTGVQVHGAACSQLLAGDVLEVKILSGCPTVLR
jgi:hypothetical protein